MPPPEKDAAASSPDALRSSIEPKRSADDKPVMDEVTDMRAALTNSLFTAESEIHDKRLLSIGGIFEVMKQLGIEYIDKTPGTPMNSDAIIGACAKYENRVLGEALALVYMGRLARDANEFPMYVHNETQDPFNAYLGSLELLDDYLDAQSTGASLPTGRLTEYMATCREPEFAKAMEEASGFEDNLFRVLHENGGADIVLKERVENTGVVLYDSKGKMIGLYTAFQLRERALEKDAELQAHTVKGGSGGVWDALLAGQPVVNAGPDPHAFTKKFFPLKEYPVGAVPDSAAAQEVVAVLPMYPDKPDALFKIILPGVGVGIPYTIEIITGDKNHMEDCRLIETEGGPGIVGLPSRANSGREQFFSARKGSDLGPKRSGEAERAGKRLSTGVIIIMKPAVKGQDHGFLHAVAWIMRHRATKPTKPEIFRMQLANEISKSGKDGERAMAMLMERSVFEEGAEADGIRGWLKEPQDLPFLCSMLKLLPEQGSEWTVPGLTSAARQILNDGRSSDELLTLLVSKGLVPADKQELLQKALEAAKKVPPPALRGSLRGFGGGEGGGLMTMGMRSAPGGDFLHTGSSGMATGNFFAQAKEKWETDPLRPPRILIMRPFGISGKEQDDTLDRVLEHLN